MLLATASVLTVVDQATKAAVDAAIGPGRAARRIDLIGDWVAFEYSENRGAAFGVLDGAAPILALASIAIVIGLLIFYLGVERPSRWLTVAVGAVVGGAVGNLIDRVQRGYVVDFVSVGPWPNFNVGDSAITLGVLALVVGWAKTGRLFGTPISAC